MKHDENIASPAFQLNLEIVLYTDNDFSNLRNRMISEN